VPITVWRKSREVSLQIQVAEMPPEAVAALVQPAATEADDENAGRSADATRSAPRLLDGLQLVELTPALRRQWKVTPETSGLLVQALAPLNGLSGKLKVGDVVTTARTSQMTSFMPLDKLNRYQAFLGKVQADEPVLLMISREGTVRYEMITPSSVLSQP
jgi:hypothetical protein